MELYTRYCTMELKYAHANLRNMRAGTGRSTQILFTLCIYYTCRKAVVAVAVKLTPIAGAGTMTDSSTERLCTVGKRTERTESTHWYCV